MPSILLLDNAAKVRLVIDVISDVGSFHLAVEPSLDIPPGNISASRVMAILTNLPNVVQALPIDQWLKNALITAYNSLQLVMYPSKLIEEIGDFHWLNQRRINLTDLSLAWDVDAGLLKLIVSATVNSALPYFQVRLEPWVGDDEIIFSCNVEVTVVEALIVELADDVVWHGWPNVICPKGSQITVNMGDVGIVFGPVYKVWVHYVIDDTFYVRLYSVWADGQYYGPTSQIN